MIKAGHCTTIQDLNPKPKIRGIMTGWLKKKQKQEEQWNQIDVFFLVECFTPSLEAHQVYT